MDQIAKYRKNITKVCISSIRDGEGEGEPLPGVGQWIRRLQLGRHVANDGLVYSTRSLTSLVELGSRGRVRGQMQLAEAAPAATRYLDSHNFNSSKEINFSLHKIIGMRYEKDLLYNGILTFKLIHSLEGKSVLATALQRRLCIAFQASASNQGKKRHTTVTVYRTFIKRLF
jgi:hypothetical protein